MEAGGPDGERPTGQTSVLHFAFRQKGGHNKEFMTKWLNNYMRLNAQEKVRELGGKRRRGKVGFRLLVSRLSVLPSIPESNIDYEHVIRRGLCILHIYIYI